MGLPPRTQEKLVANESEASDLQVIYNRFWPPTRISCSPNIPCGKRRKLHTEQTMSMHTPKFNNGAQFT